jgi:hypothetical protein
MIRQCQGQAQRIPQNAQAQRVSILYNTRISSISGAFCKDAGTMQQPVLGVTE